jgi:hypothetical protein
MGALALGQPVQETVILTHERLFAPIFDGFKAPPMKYKIGEIRELIKAGRYDETAGIPVEQLDSIYHDPRMLWTNPFMPACDMLVNTDVFGSVSEYERSLDFSSGLGKVEYKLGGVRYFREFFASRSDGIGVLKLSSDKPAKYTIALAKHPEDSLYDFHSSHCMKRELDEPQVFSEGDEIVLRCKFTYRQGRFYTARAKAVQLKGSGCIARAMLSRHLMLDNVKEAVILFSIEMDEEESAMEKCLIYSYDELLESHKAIHGDMFQRAEMLLESHVHMRKSLLVDMPAEDDEKIWEESRNKMPISPEFLNKAFYAGQYEILSSCGFYPPNLQGVWTGAYGVCWSSDYTNGGNAQTSILSLLPSGMFECMQSLFNYLESLMDHFRRNARALYNCGGIYIPIRTSDSGHAFHFGASHPTLFWTAGAAWFSRFYYDYWLYTCDDAFFINRALPFMKEAAQFYLDFLVEDENGFWLFSPSYSPENCPANSSSPVCINATMDIAASRELFSNLISACESLGIERESIGKWREILSKMPPYLINADGALKEWATPLLEDRYDHLRSSHLYMLYYDIPQDFKENSELMNAARKAYKLRMKANSQDRGIMSLGQIQCGMAAAHLQDAEMVDAILNSISKSNYYPTYATSHDAGPYIFNADISGGLPALMFEAVAQSSPMIDDKGAIFAFNIVLLPALPECMKSGKVRGMRLRGGFSLDMEWRDKIILDYKLSRLTEVSYPYAVYTVNRE